MRSIDGGTPAYAQPAFLTPHRYSLQVPGTPLPLFMVSLLYAALDPEPFIQENTSTTHTTYTDLVSFSFASFGTKFFIPALDGDSFIDNFISKT